MCWLLASAAEFLVTLVLHKLSVQIQRCSMSKASSHVIKHDQMLLLKFGDELVPLRAFPWRPAQEHEVQEHGSPPASPSQRMSDHDVNKLILVTPSRRRGAGEGASKASGPSREDAAVITDGLNYFQQEHSHKQASVPEVRELLSINRTP